MQGGDANQIKGADWTVTLNLNSPYPNPELQIKGADAVLAWIFSQLPFVPGNNPNEIVSLSWPTNMEAQDLFPLASSTYTFPTGTKVDVPCSAQNKVVDIERTECPGSFVNPMDPNHANPCVKVLHGRVPDVYTRSVFLSFPMPCIALAVLPSGSILRRGV